MGSHCPSGYYGAGYLYPNGYPAPPHLPRKVFRMTIARAVVGHMLLSQDRFYGGQQPSVPNMPSVPTGIRFYSVQSGRVRVDYAAPTRWDDAGGTGSRSWQIEFRSGTSLANLMGMTYGSIITRTSAGTYEQRLTLPTHMQARVRVVNRLNVPSDWVETIVLSAPTAPPSNLRLISVSNNGGTFTWSCDVTPETSFISWQYRRGTGAWQDIFDGNQQLSISPNGRYQEYEGTGGIGQLFQIRVQSVNGFGRSAYVESNQVTST